jgi:anti-anti-sigma regulatory factor
MAITFEAESRKQALRISGLSPHMVQIFHLVGLTNHIKIFPTGEEALKNWK